MATVTTDVFFLEEEITFHFEDYPLDGFSTILISEFVRVYTNKANLRKFAEELLKELDK